MTSFPVVKDVYDDSSDGGKFLSCWTAVSDASGKEAAPASQFRFPGSQVWARYPRATFQKAYGSLSAQVMRSEMKMIACAYDPI